MDRLAIICMTAAVLVGIAAVVDHANKRARMNRAEVAEWYCEHKGTRCGGASSEHIEAHWNQREWGYEVAVVALGGFGVARIALTSRRARRP